MDVQSETWLDWHGCKLMDLPQLPIATPADRHVVSDAALFRSFATGYVTRECRRAQSLSVLCLHPAPRLFLFLYPLTIPCYGALDAGPLVSFA